MVRGKKVLEKRSLVKKSSKKRSLLTENPKNLLRKVEQILNFYRLILSDDPIHTSKDLFFPGGPFFPWTFFRDLLQITPE